MKTIYISFIGELPSKYTGAIHWKDGSKWWQLNGEFHRIEGPAIVRVNGSVSGCTFYSDTPGPSEVHSIDRQHYQHHTLGTQ